MPRRRPFITTLVAASTLTALAACGSSQAAPGMAPKDPVVIELFQSQGCSSCPPANADLNAIAGRSDVLALSFAVTYWDRLGWKDTFGSPRYTERQQNFASAGQGQAATPEFIIDGSYAVVGANRPRLEASIAKAASAKSGPGISVAPSGIRIEQARTASPATVWLVRYDPRTREVPIRAGENGGRTLPHRNVVRELVRLGDWRGPAASFALPAAHETGLASAVLVQRGSGGPILSARKL